MLKHNETTTKKYKLKSMPSAQTHVEIERALMDGHLVNIWLVSYKTPVLCINLNDETGEITLGVCCRVDYSRTTARHVNRFTTEFFGENLYHQLKKYDFENHHPYNVDFYLHTILETLQWYENNGKRVY